MNQTIQNLTAIAAYLRVVPENQFDISSWSGVTPCGTVYCAIGHAAAAGIVPGLTLHRGKFDNDVFPTFKDPETGAVYEGWGAVRKILPGFDEETLWELSRFLFNGAEYGNPSEETGYLIDFPVVPPGAVIDRIKRAAAVLTIINLFKELQS